MKDELIKLQAKLLAAKTLEEKLKIKDQIRKLQGKVPGDYQQIECVGCGA